MKPWIPKGSHGLPLIVGLAALMVALACGNVTTRQERLAARGMLPSAQRPPEAATETGSANHPTTPEAQPPSSAANKGWDPTGADSPPTSTSDPLARPAAGTPRIAPDQAAGTSSRGIEHARPSAAEPASERPGPEGAQSQPERPTVRSDLVLGSFGAEAGLLGRNQLPAIAAIRAWTAEVNSRGGLNGHRVRLITADDGGDPARSQAIVRHMVEQDHVVAFFYPFTIGTLVPTLPYLEAHGVPVLGHIGAETQADYSPAVFHPLTGADKGTAWGFVLGITSQTENRKLGILYCQEVAACTLVRDGIKRILPYKDLRDVYDAQISIAQPDYTAQVIGAQQAGVDVLVVFADTATVNRVAVSAHRQGYRPVLSAPHNVQSSELGAYDDLDGLTFYSRVFPYGSEPMSQYRAAIGQYQPNQPLGELGAAAYVTGRLLEKIAPLLGAAPTSAEVAEALYSLQNETLGGLLPPITFPRNKDRSEVNLCVIPITYTHHAFVTLGGPMTFVCAPDSNNKPGGAPSRGGAGGWHD